MGQAKRKQQRHCPALGEIITPTTCGSNRISKIPCTSDCPHNPFNPDNYLSSYQAIEAKVLDQLSRMLYAELDFAQKRKISNAYGKRESFVSNTLHIWYLHGERRVEKWLERGDFRDWKNDELTVVRSLVTIRVALLEVQCVLDDRRTLVCDLLRPEQAPFVLLDTVSASRACRFSVFLTWIYEIPGGFRRLSGLALSLPRTGDHPPREMFEMIITHLGAPATGRDSWLLEHMADIQAALVATATARDARRYELSDFTTCERTCRVDDSTLRKLPTALRSSPQIQDDGPDTSKAVFSGSLLDSPASDETTTTSIGTIAVFPDGEIKLMSMGKENARALLDFMQILAPRLEITSEELQDHARKKRESLPSWDAKLVPPALLEQVSPISLRSERIPSHQKPSMQTVTESSYRDFADTAIPLLDDRSPRDAASDPLLRPHLIELMKIHLASIDQQRRSDGLDFDLNPLLEELGLREIIQPPAPRGNIQHLEDEDDGDHAEILMPPAQMMIGNEELDRRMDVVMADRELLADASMQIHELLGAMHELSLDLNDTEITEIQVAASIAQALIHPTLPEDFFPDRDSMIARLALFLSEILEPAPGESVIEIMERIGKSTRQQAVLNMCLATFNIGKQISKTSAKPRPKMFLPMTLALSACICEIALWPPNR